jgi:hypothetical protein
MNNFFYNFGKAFAYLMIITVLLLLLFGVFLYVCENIFGVTPHFYYTKYHH